MMVLSAYGRLGRDPRRLETKTGKTMAACAVAVTLNGKPDEPPYTQWLDVLAFGHAAEDLLRCGKGDMVGLMGRAGVSRYEKKDGATVEALQVIADSVTSSKSVRPGKSKTAREFDDDLSF